MFFDCYLWYFIHNKFMINQKGDIMNLQSSIFCLSFLLLSVTVFTVRSTSSEDLVGKSAPLFIRKAIFPDGSVADLDLQKYIGKKIILYFYPMDTTPGCTKQAQLFRDGIAKLQAQNIYVIGVSCDSIKSHRKFQQKNQIPYPLVSDARFRRPVSEKYNASGFLSSKRKTFLINEQGIVFKVFDEVDIAHQIDDILASFAQDNKK